jgi:pimeloyl-ACP methyl ester carboxylesterase
MSTQGFRAAQQRLLDHHGLEADSRFVGLPVLDGGDAHVLVSGNGPPVLMVIGGGPPAALWVPLMAELEGFTLFVADLPGFGLSDPMPYTTPTLRPAGVAFLQQLLDALELGAPPVVAQSMGALWSVSLALDEPERVPCLSLVGCPALIEGTSAPPLLRLTSVPWLRRLLLRLERPSPAAVGRFTRMAGEDLTHLPQMREVLLEHMRLPNPGPALLTMHHAALTPRGSRPQVALTAAQLSRLTQPVQLIWGRDDPFGSVEAGTRAAEHIPDARLHVVPGGHGPWLDDPTAVAALLTPFLLENGARARPPAA